jgi:dTMP kinase
MISSTAGALTGFFIVFEGIDGCGKTTQLERLYDWLTAGSGREWVGGSGSERVLRTREPGATELGKSLRSLLLKSDWEAMDPTAELLLYAADRAQNVRQVILPQIQRGGWVLCDRHTDSTIAYQGYGRGLDLGLIQQLNHIATGGLVSDLTLWMDVPVELARSRLQARSLQKAGENGDKLDRMEAADLSFHERVRQGFADLAAQGSDRLVRIEGQGDPDTIALQIRSIVQERLR